MASTKRKRSRESASTEPSSKRQTLESRTLTVPSNGRTPKSRTPTSRKSRKGRTLTTTATGRKRRGRSKNPSSPISRSRKRPKVLQLAYRDGLCHPLNCIILSLLPAAAPPSPMECPSCGGSTCVLCLGHHYLIREDDPPEYRELVTASYCYLPPTAPPPTTHFRRVGWNQKQIVAKVMEELLRKENALCAGYDEQSGFSSVGAVLCTSAWDMLLERIGDNLMVFLLRYSSIFVLLTNRIYQQLTGPLLNKVVQGRKLDNPDGMQVKFCSNSAMDRLEKTLNYCSEVYKKRKRKFSWQRREKNGKMTSERFLSYMLETSEHNAAKIDRRPIFYSNSPFLSTFPIWYIFSRAKPGNCGANFLIKEIFGFSKKDFQLCTDYKVYYYLLRLLASLMKNAKHCNLKKLLHKHLKQCPFPTCEKCKKVDYGSKVVNLAECCCSHHEVVLFVWDVIRHIVPIELLGDCSNWRTFMPNISKFIRLRRFESFSPSHTSQHHFLSKISRWLFENIIIPSIRSCFYVTEMQFRKQEVFYFPKPLWRKLANDAIGCLDEHCYKLLDRDSVPYIINKRNFGYATTRFLPKKTEMRILANTRAPCKSSRDGRSFFVKSVNSSLKELHTVLRKIKYEKPEKLGSSVFGYDDVYQKFYGFLRRVGSGELMKTDVFIVVGDVAKAFDSVDQDKLIGIIKCLSQEDNYHLRSYARVLSAKNGLRALQDHVGYDLTSNTNDIIKFEANTRLRSSSCVIIDQGESKHTKKEVLDHLLTENVKHNILNIDNKFYLQKVGIGQGSPISPLLCSFYLGDLERSIIFPFLREVCNKKNVPCSIPSHSIEQTEDDLSCLGSSFIIDSNGKHWSRTDDAIRCCNDKGMHENVLMRWIDDFLFISTCKKQATSFFRRMQRGFKEYNCDMNSEKFCISFDVKQNNHRQNSLYEGADGIQFIPWCGLLLNCRTLEIQADYTRYLGIPIWSTLTVDANDNCLFTLKDKLCSFGRPKCHPLFYDSYINSPQVVGLNAYQAFLLCAMKFHCFISSISDNTQLDPSSLLEAIEQSFRFMYKLLKRKMSKMGSYSGRPLLKLKKAEMIGLGLSAYLWVLNRKQAKYKELLSLLKYKISSYGRMGGDSYIMKYAVDDSHSSVFKGIQF